MGEPQLAVVFSAREWADRVVRHVTNHGGGRVRLRVVEGRVALEEEFDVLIAEDVTSFLTHRLVQELHRRSRNVLGVYDPAEPTGRERLLEMGVDEVIEATASADQFVRAIGSIVPMAGPGGIGVADAWAPMRAPGIAPGLRRSGGRLWAVGGPPGGCGASEVAVELARTLRQRGEDVALVDADDVAPSLAQRLGFPPIPNIRSAIDALVHGAGLISDTLMPAAGGCFDLLAGLANPADWSQVRPQDVVDVVGEIRRSRAAVVVNVGSQLEDLVQHGGPDRFGATRGLLVSADAIIGVGLPSPLGVARLLAWVAEVAALAPAVPLHLVVNRAPGSWFIRGEVESELRRNLEPGSLTFVPDDDAVAKAAWRGELVPGGPFTRAVADLATAAGAAPLGAEGRVWRPSRRRAGGRSA